MQFYKNIVVGLKKVFDEFIAKDANIEQEMVYFQIKLKVENFALTAVSGAKDEKHAVADNNLLEFFTFVLALSGIENEAVRNGVFEYLAANGFPGLDVTASSKKNVVVALLKNFMSHGEVTLVDVRNWIKAGDQNLIGDLNVELAKILLKKKLHNKPLVEVKKYLKEFTQQKIINEEQYLNWLKKYDIPELVTHIFNRPTRLPPAQHVVLLNAIAVAGPIDVLMNAKQKILQLLLEQRKANRLTKEILHKWIISNDHEQQLLRTYIKRFPNECKFSPEDNSLILAHWLSFESDGFAEMWSWIQLNNKDNVLFDQIDGYLTKHPQRLNTQQKATIQKSRDHNADAKREAPSLRI